MKSSLIWLCIVFEIALAADYFSDLEDIIDGLDFAFEFDIDDCDNEKAYMDAGRSFGLMFVSDDREMDLSEVVMNRRAEELITLGGESASRIKDSE